MKKTIALNNDWTFRQVSVDTNGKDTPWLNATVPGHVHLDLLDNHVIDDPYWRDNEKSQQWIGEVDWEYQTHFNYADALSGNSHYEMCFDGLDTYADVYLNDQLILTADNMYDGWRVNVKDFLVHGSNHLRIVFHSVIKRTLPLYQENGFVYPANTSQPEPKLSVYSRKPGYHFGWDWGPRLVTCGIWRPICLEVFSCNRLSDVQFVQHSLDSTVSVLSLNVELNAPAESELSLSLIDADNSFEPVTLTIAPSTAAAVVHFTIDNPKFWWTLGLGEQPLYKLSLSLLKDGSVIDSWQHNVGLRTVELVHEDDESGKSFYFKLNGEPLYIKGSNCIPADFFVPRLGEIDYRKMLGYAVDANMNMLRLWGGAIYEEKVFYTLCDELGVLVWQDFMFACAAYPCGTEMAERIASEAAYNVKRIRNHTSLALWCGNNEISEGWHTWGWQQRYEYDEATCEKVWREYEAIFHEILPQAVAQYDPSRAYWASSPKYGFVDPKAKTDGDMHYWGVWFLGHERNGFNEYLPRFMSEYGLQAMPELKTFEAFSLPEDWDIQSSVLQTHQKQYANPSKNQFLDGYGMMIKYLEREYTVPKDFEQLAYMTQLLQADYLAFAIKAHRHNRPYCMGTMYWQLNDMWPVTSWASVDYFGRWKASHYAIRETYKPVIVVIVEEGDNTVLKVVSDKLDNTPVNVTLNLLSFGGEQYVTENLQVVAVANSSTEIFRCLTSDLLNQRNSHQCVLQAICYEKGEEVSSDLHYFHTNKALEFDSPELSIVVEQEGDIYTLVISTNTLVKNLFLKVDQHLLLNYFDVLPGQHCRIPLEKKITQNIEYIHYELCQ